MPWVQTKRDCWAEHRPRRRELIPLLWGSHARMGYRYRYGPCRLSCLNSSMKLDDAQSVRVVSNCVLEMKKNVPFFHRWFVDCLLTFHGFSLIFN